MITGRSETKEIKPPNSCSIELSSSGTQRIARGNQSRKLNRPEKGQIYGLEFELRFTCNSRNKAKSEASKYRKRGFHTRVIEIYPGTFSVYRRSKTPE
jgi:hypothetical protein